MGVGVFVVVRGNVVDVTSRWVSLSRESKIRQFYTDNGLTIMKLADAENQKVLELYLREKKIKAIIMHRAREDGTSSDEGKSKRSVEEGKEGGTEGE